MVILTGIGWKNANIAVAVGQKSSISNRMAPLQMLYIMTLTYIFKVIKFEIWITTFSCYAFVITKLHRQRISRQICLDTHGPPPSSRRGVALVNVLIKCKWDYIIRLQLFFIWGWNEVLFWTCNYKIKFVFTHYNHLKLNSVKVLYDCSCHYCQIYHIITIYIYIYIYIYICIYIYIYVYIYICCSYEHQDHKCRLLVSSPLM